MKTEYYIAMVLLFSFYCDSGWKNRITIYREFKFFFSNKLNKNGFGRTEMLENVKQWWNDEKENSRG